MGLAVRGEGLGHRRLPDGVRAFGRIWVRNVLPSPRSTSSPLHSVSSLRGRPCRSRGPVPAQRHRLQHTSTTSIWRGQRQPGSALPPPRGARARPFASPSSLRSPRHAGHGAAHAARSPERQHACALMQLHRRCNRAAGRGIAAGPLSGGQRRLTGNAASSHAASSHEPSTIFQV